MPPGTVWTPEEDQELRRLVEELGEKKWAQISSLIKTKTSKQCRRRWLNHLNMESKKCGWSREEDVKLVELHRTHGNKWTEIARLIGGRTDNAVKNRYHALVRKDEKAKANSSGSLTNSSELSDDMQAAYAANLHDAHRFLDRSDCSLEKLRAELNSKETRHMEDARMRAVQAVDHDVEMKISRRPHDLTIVIPQEALPCTQPLPVGQIFVQQDLLSPVEKKLAEEVNDMDEVPVHISFINEGAEAPEIMDYTALNPETIFGGQAVAVTNGGDGENTICVFPSAGSILETLRTNCTPKGSGPVAPWSVEPVDQLKVESAGNLVTSSMSALAPDSSLGCLNDEHKKLLSRLFTEGKRPSGDLGNSGLQTSTVPIECAMEPETVKEEGKQEYGWRDVPKRKRSTKGEPDIPASPFFCRPPEAEAPLALSPSAGVQLSPIFSQVDLESLLSVISPLSSLPSADYLDILAATSQASGCRIVDAVHVDSGRDAMDLDEWAGLRK